MRPIAVDLFAGAGGTTLGLRRAGFDVRVAVDCDPHKARTLSINNPGVNVLGIPGTVGDVRRIDGNTIRSAGGIRKGSVALVSGCPPCQGFSLQGNRDPGDPRNELPFEFTRLVRELAPRSVVFENVVGIKSFSSGSVIGSVNGRLHRAGYETEMWELDAQDYGVPQARKRIFVIGLRGIDLPMPPRPSGKTIGAWEAIADLPARRMSSRCAESMPIRYRSDSRSSFAKAMRGRRRRVANCETTTHAPSILRRITSLDWEERDDKTWHRRLHPRKPAPTLTAGSRTRTACRPIHPYSDRVITVREGARLASFPDWYRFPRHIAESWSQIGNAVPPMIAEKIFRRIRDCLE